MLHRPDSTISRQLDDRLSSFERMASRYAEEAYAPYSGQKSACVLILGDGDVVPGVRVENASYPLTIPELHNAHTTAVSSGRQDLVGVVFNRDVDDDDVRMWASLVRTDNAVIGDRYILRRGAELPEPGAVAVAPNAASAEIDVPAGVSLARMAADKAHVPISNFPVGCVVVLKDGAYVQGANVENRDWTRILCAERNAVGTAVTLGRRDFAHIYVSAPRDSMVSPCGACRQVLVELAADVPITIDRGSQPHQTLTPGRMLPGWFSGAGLRKGL